MPTIPSKLTHFDAQGQAHMVDVGDKSATHRIAQATGFINLSAEAYAQLRAGTAHKGDVLGVARIAAIQASKQTAHLIPLCHPLALTRVAVAFRLDDALHRVHMDVTCETHGQTGVEMEALTSVSVGLLTIYDCSKRWIKPCALVASCWYPSRAVKADTLSTHMRAIHKITYETKR